MKRVCFKKGTLELANIASRLFIRGLHFRFRRFLGRGGLPTAVSLEITQKCVARCAMCNIWKISHDVPSLSVSDWLHVLSSNLFRQLKEVDITGGEPYLVEDLPDFVKQISYLSRKNLTSLCSVIITTNGILTEKILRMTERMVKVLESHGIELIIVCGLDGIGRTHDIIRGVTGAWERHRLTMIGLLKLRKHYPNLVLGIKTTILPLNVSQLKRILSYADQNQLFSIVSPVIITSGRYQNKEKALLLQFNSEQVKQILEFYMTFEHRWKFHSQQIIRLLKSGALSRKCICGFNYFFIRYNGDLYFCPLSGSKVGNVLEIPVENIWKSGYASKRRKTISKMKSCHFCTEPGIERYSLPYEGFDLLKYLFKEGPIAFQDLFYHMGLDKHF